jgi:DNA-binding NtrC family response regulator
MHFLRKYAAADGKDVTGFSDEALSRITRYAWPGNVRELENAIERAVVVSRSDQVQEGDLAPSVVAGASQSRDGLPPVPGATLAELERYAILRTLEHTGGSTSRAAEMLGISPRKIQYRLREYSGDGRPRNGRSGDDDTAQDE